MAEPPPDPDSNHPGVGPDRGSTTGMPRWVKVFVILVIALLLAFVVSLLAGVRHGPGLHTPSGGLDGYVPRIEHELERP